jgi:hypothetical protein
MSITAAEPADASLRAPVDRGDGFNATGGAGARSPASFDVDQSGRPDAAQ